MATGLSELEAPPRHPTPRPRHRRRARRLLVVALIVLALILALAAWIGARAYRADQELQAAIPDLDVVRSAVESDDTTRMQAAAADLETHARNAVSLTSDPVWRAAENAPWAGANLTAVRTVAQAADTIAAQVVRPLVSIARSADPRELTLSHGRIDLAPLIAAQPGVEKAQAGFEEARHAVGALDDGGLIAPVARGVTRVRAMLASVEPQVEAVADTARLLPGMLGAAGPRSYLLVAQNPAELRATGGLIGSVALITADHGAIALASQAAGTTIGPWQEPVPYIPAATSALYGPTVGRFIQDANVTPDFPLAARTAAAMWVRKHGGVVDGVVAVDPVVLGTVLRATGPVALPTGDVLTADNVVRLLLSDVYRRFSVPAEQDAFFASAAAAVFGRMADGGVHGSALVSILAASGASDRLHVWSSHPGEQSVLATTTLAGGLPESTSRTAALGVYFNDGTGAKMDYYLATAVSAGAAVCRADGKVTSLVEVTLTNRAPADAAVSLPPYVTGDGAFGVPRGSILTRIAFYGPERGLLAGVRSHGIALPSVAGTDSGRPVAVVAVELAPGEARTVDVEFLGTQQKAPGVTVAVTPTLGTPTTGKGEATPVVGSKSAIGTIAVPCSSAVK